MISWYWQLRNAEQWLTPLLETRILYGFRFSSPKLKSCEIKKFQSPNGWRIFQRHQVLRLYTRLQNQWPNKFKNCADLHLISRAEVQRPLIVNLGLEGCVLRISIKKKLEILGQSAHRCIWNKKVKYRISSNRSPRGFYFFVWSGRPATICFSPLFRAPNW